MTSFLKLGGGGCRTLKAPDLRRLGGPPSTQRTAQRHNSATAAAAQRYNVCLQRTSTFELLVVISFSDSSNRIVNSFRRLQRMLQRVLNAWKIVRTVSEDSVQIQRSEGSPSVQAVFQASVPRWVARYCSECLRPAFGRPSNTIICSAPISNSPILQIRSDYLQWYCSSPLVSGQLLFCQPVCALRFHLSQTF